MTSDAEDGIALDICIMRKNTALERKRRSGRIKTTWWRMVEDDR